MPSFFRSRGFRWGVLVPVMVIAFVVSAGFVSFHLTRAAAIPKRDKVVAELDAADPNWRLTDLTTARNATLPPPERNAADLGYLVVLKLPKEYRDWDKRANSGQWRSDLKNPHLPHRSDVADTRKHLLKAKESVELARSIRHVPGGGFQLVPNERNPLGTLLPKHQELRQTYSLLSFDALVRAYDRRGDEALDSCHAILATARGFGDDPLLISQLIRIAGVAISVGTLERTLCWTDGLDDKKLAELDRAFEKEAGEPRLVYGFRGERGMFDRICTNIDDGTQSMSELADSKPRFGERLLTAPFRARLPAEHAVGLEMYGKLIAAAEHPAGRTRTEALAEVEFEYTKLARGRVGPAPRYLLLGLLMPAVSKMCEADNRTVANLNAARVAIACERHRLKTGAYPEKLEDLPKELLPEVPTDPFSGKPILYKKLADGAVAYSVGGDGADDGAVKIDPRNEKGNDLGFRLWTPEHRRKPPLPREADPSADFFVFGPGTEQPKGDKPDAPPPLSPWVKKE